mmetsp:Transcript_30423/g.39849  ORF Transcript_30423/g.39849 Transcript_30423/m.39849 type:complete len:188 (+) Transcript_30423:108-671(+)|eukprot:CAMPEP_0195267834 /NCGR_PEP_ID=MMETSP0706-20130129/12814_1 /TAXON_ID=33640 /ORGANISM="Asterionellopsis glacialis, Strain CCMP134" /LENGTH=187 /DNA_ID=CAMNT_0040322637 /DNA_START=104 /DNA_END=667 /DNA_ORIENTATION=-
MSEDQYLVREQDYTSHPRKSVVALITVAVGAVLLLSVGYAKSTSNDATYIEGSDPLLRVGSSNAAPPCTYDECYPMRCNAKLHPYLCLEKNGGWHGGCSSNEWLDYTCDRQCNLEDCDSYEVPDDASCKGVECDADWCEWAGKKCSSAAPFQCVDGGGRLGCSGDEMHWTIGTTSCVKCCDTDTCTK